MWYINLHPVNNNHGNPTSSPAPDSLALPDELLSAYIDTRGFALIDSKGGVVTAVSVNQAALDAYLVDHLDKPPEPPQSSLEDDLIDIILDHEERLALMELA